MIQGLNNSNRVLGVIIVQRKEGILLVSISTAILHDEAGRDDWSPFTSCQWGPAAMIHDL